MIDILAVGCKLSVGEASCSRILFCASRKINLWSPRLEPHQKPWAQFSCTSGFDQDFSMYKLRILVL